MVNVHNDDRIIILFDKEYPSKSYIGKEMKVYYSDGYYELKDPCIFDLSPTSMRRCEEKSIRIYDIGLSNDEGYRYQEMGIYQELIDKYYKTIDEA